MFECWSSPYYRFVAWASFYYMRLTDALIFLLFCHTIKFLLFHDPQQNAAIVCNSFFDCYYKGIPSIWKAHVLSRHCTHSTRLLESSQCMTCAESMQYILCCHSTYWTGTSVYYSSGSLGLHHQ